MGSLLPENIIRLTHIFNSKKWPIDTGDPADDPVLFDKFCHLLSELSDDEQDLILTLTEDFSRFTYYDYPKLMNKALLKVDPILIRDAEMVFLIPLVSPKDMEKGESKSGHALPYTTLRTVIPSHSYLKDKKVKAIESLSLLESQHCNRNNALLLILDDFIGTGNTACKFLDEYCRYYQVRSDSLVIASLVIQKAGMEAIRDLGFDVVAAHIRQRGISDSNKIPDPMKALSIMDCVEDRLKINTRYRRGYGQSEALVKMIRIPNNTFPVYWCAKTTNGDEWPAPFRR